MTNSSIRLWYWPLVAATAMVAAIGCRNSKGLVPVEGRVTFDGSQPRGPGCLYFVPREMSVNQRHDRSGALPGTGLFLQDGVYRAGTFMPGDGLRPGTYEVRVECSSATSDSHDATAASLVSTGFAAPDLVVDPEAQRPVQYHIDVRPP